MSKKKMPQDKKKVKRNFSLTREAIAILRKVNPENLSQAAEQIIRQSDQKSLWA